MKHIQRDISKCWVSPDTAKRALHSLVGKDLLFNDPHQKYIDIKRNKDSFRRNNGRWKNMTGTSRSN